MKNTFLTWVYMICKIKKRDFMACVNVGLKISNKDNSLLGFSITIIFYCKRFKIEHDLQKYTCKTKS